MSYEEIMAYVYVAIKLIIGLGTFILALRTTSKGQLNQMSPLDLIGNFVMGGILGGVIYSDNVTIHRFIIVLVIWQTLIIVVKKLSQSSSSARKVIVGTETPLVVDGKFQLDRFNELDMDISSFATLLRMKGIFSLSDVRHAQMEPNSQLTVIKYDEKRVSALVVKDGEVSEEGLKFIEHDEDWLMGELKKQGYTELDDIFFAEWTEEHDESGTLVKGDLLIVNKSQTETDEQRDAKSKMKDDPLHPDAKRHTDKT